MSTRCTLCDGVHTTNSNRDYLSTRHLFIYIQIHLVFMLSIPSTPISVRIFHLLRRPCCIDRLRHSRKHVSKIAINFVFFFFVFFFMLLSSPYTLAFKLMLSENLEKRLVCAGIECIVREACVMCIVYVSQSASKRLNSWSRQHVTNEMVIFVARRRRFWITGGRISLYYS